MPLDTGAVTPSLLMSAGVDINETNERPDMVLEGALNVGAALRATRQRHGRSLQDISDATRIKRSYLDAIEEMRLEELPSRPFTIGYVRAYAMALGLDGDAAVERFKQDAPGGVEPLRAPVGVRKHADARLSLLAGGGAVVVSAVLLWNVVQHAMADNAAAPSVVAETSAPAPAPAPASATVAISAAQPAPQDSNGPPPYQTPGLDGSTSSGAAAATAAGQTPASSAAVNAAEASAFQTFSPHGAVYGAPAQASVVTLQARKSVSLVVRGADGQVYFAQQMKAGEAYRAPKGANLTADISDTAAVRVYVKGQLHPDLATPVTPLAKLASDGTADDGADAGA